MLLSGLSGVVRGCSKTRRNRRRSPDFGPRPISCYPSRRTKAGCPSGQWKRTVNPSRELRRFESFTCHPVLGRAFDQRKRRSGALLPSRRGVRLTTAGDGLLRLSVGKSWQILGGDVRAGMASLVCRRSEGDLDALACSLVLADDARRVDAEEHVDAVPGPLGD